VEGEPALRQVAQAADRLAVREVRGGNTTPARGVIGTTKFSTRKGLNMRRIPVILTLAALGSGAVGNVAAPAGAAPSRSTTIAVKATPTEDETRKGPTRTYKGPRPRNPDNIVENIGIALPTVDPPVPPR
jgi:hypothetical protein